jgi:hypothetical protein
LIDAIDEGRIGARPLTVLRDVSEAMLLARDASRATLEGELDEVASVLKELIETDALGVETAGRLWRVILASGPPGPARADEVSVSDG